MMRKIVAVLFMVLVIVSPCYAQPEELPAEGEMESDDAPEQKTEAYVLEGDVVLLKSGKELRGVNVIRENPMFVEIEFLPGEAPLQLPRNQVERVDYAESKAGSGKAGGLGDVRLVPDIMPGEEVSVELHQMLMTPMSNEEMAIDEADYLVILREFAARFNVGIEVAAALQELTPEERQISRVIPAETTFMNFLRTHMAEAAPQVRVILQYDRLLLQKREDAVPVNDLVQPLAEPSEEAPAEQ